MPTPRRSDRRVTNAPCTKNSRPLCDHRDALSRRDPDAENRTHVRSRWAQADQYTLPVSKPSTSSLGAASATPLATFSRRNPHRKLEHARSRRGRGLQLRRRRRLAVENPAISCHQCRIRADKFIARRFAQHSPVHRAEGLKSFTAVSRSRAAAHRETCALRLSWKSPVEEGRCLPSNFSPSARRLHDACRPMSAARCVLLSSHGASTGSTLICATRQHPRRAPTHGSRVGVARRSASARANEESGRAKSRAGSDATARCRVRPRARLRLIQESIIAVAHRAAQRRKKEFLVAGWPPVRSAGAVYVPSGCRLDERAHGRTRSCAADADQKQMRRSRPSKVAIAAPRTHQVSLSANLAPVKVVHLSRARERRPEVELHRRATGFRSAHRPPLGTRVRRSCQLDDSELRKPAGSVDFV